MDNFLDIRSLALMMGLVSFVFDTGMVYQFLYHKIYSGFSPWATGAISAGICGLLLFLRGYPSDRGSIYNPFFGFSNLPKDSEKQKIDP